MRMVVVIALLAWLLKVLNVEEEWQIMKSIELKIGDHETQKTFNSGLDAKVGDVITVRFEEMQEFKSDGVTYYSIQKPLPVDISELSKVWGLKEVKEAVRVGTGHLISCNREKETCADA
jgi:hypothetical protein